MNVVWNKYAYNSLNSNISYLKEKWTTRDISNFLDIVDEKVSMIVDNPYIGAMSEFNNRLRRLVITKHITLFYEVDEEQEKIYLHLFWLNFKDPNTLQMLLT